MSVNVMNGLHEKCQSVNQASFLEREPTKVFLHGCHTRVSVPVLVNMMFVTIHRLWLGLCVYMD